MKQLFNRISHSALKLAIGFGLVTLTTAPAFGGLDPHRSDSGIYGPKYEVILDDMERLQNENPDIVRLIDYGKSIKGRPLRMMVIMGGTQRLEKRPALLVTGATHGNEYLGIADHLPEKLVQLARRRNSIVNQYLRIGGTLVFVPILNPDGYAARQRGNAKGKDLNRDWDIKTANFKGFKEVESRSLALYLLTLEQQLQIKFDIIVDYHCCLGAIIHPWSYQKKFISDKDRQTHQRVAGMANESGLNVKIGSAGELIWYLPMGTTNDHHYIERNAISLTYEGRGRIEKDNLPKHVNWFQLMIRSSLVNALRSRPMFGFQWQQQDSFIQMLGEPR